MSESKNWLWKAFIGAIIATLVSIYLPKALGESVVKYQLETDRNEPLVENNIYIEIDGEKKKLKPDSDGVVKIKFNEENEGEEVNLKVIDKDGKEQYSQNIKLEEQEDKQPKKLIVPTKKFVREVKTTDNYKFSFHSLRREGGCVIMHLTITNLSDEERLLEFNSQRSTIYTNNNYTNDTSGNRQKASACILNNCTRGGWSINDPKQRFRPEQTLNANIAFWGIPREATEIIEGRFCYNGNSFVEVNNIELPKIKAGLNIAISGDFVVEWKGANRKDKVVNLEFNVANTASDIRTFHVGKSVVYDDIGNKYTANNAAFRLPTNKRVNQEEILQSINENFYISIDNFDKKATKIERVEVNIGNTHTGSIRVGEYVYGFKKGKLIGE